MRYSRFAAVQTHMLFIAALTLSWLAPGEAWARQEPLDLGPSAERRWSLTGFAGQADDARFLDILPLRGGDWEPSYIAGLAVNRQLATSFNHLDWELEGSWYGHWGIQSHFEINGALVARWQRFPWDRWIDTSIAIGQGVSWASERPELEGQTRRFLNHLLAEVEVTPLRDRPVSLVLRVHHRSGVFGLYGAHGGSNFVVVGVRYRF